jgi:hypothetical protein
MKKCSKCCKEKILSEFYKQKGYCKECGRQMCRDYKKRNKQKISDYNKQYKLDHKEDIIVYNKKYNIENRTKIQTRHTKYLRNRRKTNPEYKISLTIRNRTKRILKGEKTKSTLELLGCSYCFLIKWIESQFENDMTFENHGKLWHLDHVIPCKKFNVINKVDQERCFHWTNLQPLYGLDNLKKKDKTDINEICMQQIKICNFLVKFGSYYMKQYTLLNYNKFKYL